LNKKEKRIISERLKVDYRVLLQRMLDINNKQQLLLRELSVEKTMALQQVSSSFLIHEIISQIRSMKNRLNTPDQGNIEKLIDHLRIWVDQSKRLFPNKELDISSLIYQYIDTSPYFETERNMFDYKKLKDCSCVGFFNETALEAIIQSLASNFLQAAIRKENKETICNFDVYVEDGIIHLKIIDNAGDFETFKDVIDKVNSGETHVSSRRSKHGGNGLVTLRLFIEKTTGINKMWVLEGNENKKIFIIPLCKAKQL